MKKLLDLINQILLENPNLFEMGSRIFWIPPFEVGKYEESEVTTSPV